MLKDIVKVDHLGGYRLRPEFEDTTVGEVDVSSLLEFTGVIADWGIYTIGIQR